MATDKSIRIPGQANYASNFEVQKQALLDAREMILTTAADLVKPETWEDEDGNVWLAKGLKVAVMNNGGKPELYILKDPDKYTETASWEKVGGDQWAEAPLLVLTFPGSLGEEQQEIEVGATFDEISAAIEGNRIILVKLDTAADSYYVVRSVSATESQISLTIQGNSLSMPSYIITPGTEEGKVKAFIELIGLDKRDVGLGNVTNDAQVKRSEMGKAGGVATLGSDGKVPTAQLPSIVEVELSADFGVSSADSPSTEEVAVPYETLLAAVQNGGTIIISRKLGGEIPYYSNLDVILTFDSLIQMRGRLDNLLDNGTSTAAMVIATPTENGTSFIAYPDASDGLVLTALSLSGLPTEEGQEAELTLSYAQYPELAFEDNLMEKMKGLQAVITDYSSYLRIVGYEYLVEEDAHAFYLGPTKASPNGYVMTMPYGSSGSDNTITLTVKMVTAKNVQTTVTDHDTADTTFALPPNEFHRWGEVASLSLTFAEGSPSVMNEYMFSFKSGATPTVLTLPEGVQWATDSKVEANMAYQVSIVDNIAVMAGVTTAGSEVQS